MNSSGDLGLSHRYSQYTTLRYIARDHLFLSELGMLAMRSHDRHESASKVVMG